MSNRAHDHGKYIPMNWDGDGSPAAYYVRGHVSRHQFAVELRRAGAHRVFGARIEHVFVRTVPRELGGREIRECGPGRGARAVTKWELFPNRASGA